MPNQQSGLKNRQDNDIKQPRNYKVKLHNDDFTTMDFVVMILTDVFFKSKSEANRLMMQVHEQGEAVVGIYSYDIAMSKTNKATDMAINAGFPLMVTCEPE